jgi:hypothetical protein
VGLSSLVVQSAVLPPVDPQQSQDLPELLLDASALAPAHQFLSQSSYP